VGINKGLYIGALHNPNTSPNKFRMVKENEMDRTCSTQRRNMEGMQDFRAKTRKK
jgi:hypothetical protein